jgi:two-component system response regulator AtoC
MGSFEEGRGSVLVVDRETEWVNLVQKAMGEFYQVEGVASLDRLWIKLRHDNFNVIVVNLETDKDLELIRELKINYSPIPVIATGRVSEKTPQLLARAIKEGAYDFIEKPYSLERIGLSIRNAMAQMEMKHEIDYLRREQDVIYDFGQIIAYSHSMIDVIQTLKKFAQVDATLLITGETGTGKSFLAGAVHFNSARKSRPFIKVNCANIPEQLLESELFGHAKGAFTGAIKTRVGRIEQAKGGTIFLDEIGEMSLSLQTKLLRFLEEKSFERLGSM